MFKNFYFFIFVFLTSFCCNSQKMNVLNSKTKTPVPFANYYLFLNENIVKAGYCSENGEIYIPKEVLYDKIKLTSIGYENFEILEKDIKDDTLLFVPAVYHLKEIEIIKNKTDELISLGYLKSKRKAWLSATKGMKICTFIENPFLQPKLIHSFLFKIRNNNETKLGFKLHLFEKDTITNAPGKELLKEDIVIVLEGKSKKDVEHDVSLYNIDFPAKGAFVGIEWFGVLNENNDDFNGIDTQNGYIELNDVSKEFNTFQQDVFSFFPWKNMEKFKKISEEHTNFRNCPTASFGLKLYKD